MSEEVVALIDRLIEEHRIILQDMDSLQEVVNDAGAILSFEKAKSVFMPGRIDAHSDHERLDELLSRIDTGLRAHFNREETGLHSAIETEGFEEIDNAYHLLLKEHDMLRERLTHHETIRQNLNESLKSLTEPEHGTMSRQTWEATANDIRAYIIHSRKLVHDHTAMEQVLFGNLRKLVSGETEK